MRGGVSDLWAKALGAKGPTVCREVLKNKNFSHPNSNNVSVGKHLQVMWRKECRPWCPDDVPITDCHVTKSLPKFNHFKLYSNYSLSSFCGLTSQADRSTRGFSCACGQVATGVGVS